MTNRDSKYVIIGFLFFIMIIFVFANHDFQVMTGLAVQDIPSVERNYNYTPLFLIVGIAALLLLIAYFRKGKN